MTDKPQWTPGPWHCTAKHPRHISNKRGFKVAKCLIKTKGANLEISEDEALANAHLIAAAPELYEALQEACTSLVLAAVLAADLVSAAALEDVSEKLLRYAREGQQALAKARGETE